MKILVTGGAGFIGSNFIRHLLKGHPDYEVINLDLLTYAGNPENLKDIEDHPNYRFVKDNICDSKIVEELACDCDVIINFAAQTHVDRSIAEPSDFIRTNVLGTQVLLEAAKKFKISRLIHISTDEVYGSIDKGFSKEEDPLRPNSPYAASKAAADLLVRSYQVTYKLPAIVIRSSNNFGPYQYPEKVIPLFITNALQDEKVPLYGDGMNFRDWIYVLDNCQAIDMILHAGKPGHIYNVGGGNLLTNLELTRQVLSLLDKHEDFIQYVNDRPGHDRRYALDCSKVNELGWRPRYDFQSSLRETIEWYKANADWWQSIREGREFEEYISSQYGGEEF